MSWHSHSWPGRLAIAASSNNDDQVVCAEMLKADYEVFKEAQSYSGNSTALAKMVARSPFQLTVVPEAAELASSGVPEAEVKAQLHVLSSALFSSFGQTKL